MSVLKFVNGKNSRPDQLRRILDYVDDSDKCLHNFGFTMGVGVDSAYEDMRTLKMLYNKEDKRQYLHLVLSFDADINPQTGFYATYDILRHYEKKYQIYTKFHENTNNFHAHCIINSVGIDGKKFSQSQSELRDLIAFANCQLEKHGLKKIGKIFQESFERMDKFENLFWRTDNQRHEQELYEEEWGREELCEEDDLDELEEIEGEENEPSMIEPVRIVKPEERAAEEGLYEPVQPEESAPKEAICPVMIHPVMIHPVMIYPVWIEGEGEEPD